MRKLAGPITVVLVAAVLGAAAPASATYGVVVDVPTDPVYSPYGGPATVTFTFEGGDTARVFTIRLRRPGHGPIKEKDVLVDPVEVTSPHPVSFGWQDLSVANPADYVVDVRPQGGDVITGETFTVLPPLVSGLTAAPSPFYPLIEDGFKDHTTIGFSLAADTTDTDVHVYADDVYGRCCGNEVRGEALGPLASGDHSWSWDGLRDDLSSAPKGTYFVRIGATDTEDVSAVSKPVKVVVTTGTVRITATKVKHGSAYARVTDQVQTAIGGSCIVSRDTGTHQASVLCANAAVSLVWGWGMKDGERIEKASFQIDGGLYGCHKRVSHTSTRSTLRVTSPPTSTCTIIEARITYSYPVQA
jgi:hypothetical protein